MKAFTNKIGNIPALHTKAPSPLQALSSKRNWDRLQILGSANQLKHQAFNLPLDSKTKARYIKILEEMEHVLLNTVDNQWKKNKNMVRKATEAEFLDYPPVEAEEDLKEEDLKEEAEAPKEQDRG